MNPIVAYPELEGRPPHAVMKSAGFKVRPSRYATKETFIENPRLRQSSLQYLGTHWYQPDATQRGDAIHAKLFWAAEKLEEEAGNSNRRYELGLIHDARGRLQSVFVHEYKKPD